MDEFRKQFEYDDEKGVSGVLLIFFVMVVSFEVFTGIIIACLGFQISKRYDLLFYILLVVGILYIAFSLFVGVALWKIPKYAFKIVKTFLYTRLIIGIPIHVLSLVNHISTVPKGADFYEEYLPKIISTGVFTGIYTIAFSVIWLIYFNKSSKVKSLYIDGKNLNS